MDKETVDLRIKELKEKTFNEPLNIETVVDKGDFLIISGYANKFKTVSGEVYRDSDGDAVVPEGIDLSRYSKNPIVLLNHDRDSIIGKAINFKTDENGLWMEMEIYKSLNPTAYNAIKLGVLKAFSIGFKLDDLTYDENKDLFFLTKTTLLENSVVSIPANENSLIEVVDEHLAISGKSLDTLKVKEEKPKDGYVELQELVLSLKEEMDSIKELLSKQEEEPKVVEEEPKEEDKKLSELLAEVSVEEGNFDELLQVNELLTQRLNDFLNQTLN